MNTHNLFTKVMASAAMAACLLPLAGCNERINLMDYVDVKFDGTDGYGTAEVSMNEDKLDSALGYTGSTTDAAALDGDKDAKNALAAALVLNDLEPKIDKKENLKNGDSVKVTLKFDKDALNKYGYSLTGPEEKTVKVSGLGKGETVKPFDSKYFNIDSDTKGVHIKFVGASPMLQVELDNNFDEKPYNMLSYSIDSSQMTDNSNSFPLTSSDESIYFKNGDKIKINASFNDKMTNTDSYTYENYIIPKKYRTFELEVKDQPELLKDLSNVDPSAFAQLEDNAKNQVINDVGSVGGSSNVMDCYTMNDDLETFASFFNSNVVVNSIDVQKKYLYSIKDGYFSKTEGVNASIADKCIRNDNDTPAYNGLYLICKINLSYTGKDDEQRHSRDVYEPICITNVSIDKDGNIVYDKDNLNKYGNSQYDSVETAITKQTDGLIDIYNISEQ